MITQQPFKPFNLFSFPNQTFQAIDQMAGHYGFSVFQPDLGSALQWLPAIGSPELDEMVNAYLPGPASIQDKRAHIAMDFFEYARQTGNNYKFYAAPTSFTSATTSSPASSATFHDSGFDASPVISDLSSWTQSPAAFTSLSFEEPRKTSRTSTSKKSSVSSSQQQNDFANHPGMRIMTKDGRDVTNSASRGCKTKEQRDHAHLMRIIKACDACKRKKIRCDPSHKKRSASQASSSSQSELKPAKKLKKAEGPPQPTPAPPISLDPSPGGVSPDSFDITLEGLATFPTYEEFPEIIDWSQFVFDQEPAVPAAVPAADDFDFFFNSQDYFTSSSSSTSPSHASPFTPVANELFPVVISDDNAAIPSALDPTVPYLNPGAAHGTNYTDFALYSPPRDFFLDEEPHSVRKPTFSRPSQQESLQTGATRRDEMSQTGSSQDIDVVAHMDQYHVSPNSSSPSPTICRRDRSSAAPVIIPSATDMALASPTLSHVSEAIHDQQVRHGGSLEWESERLETHQPSRSVSTGLRGDGAALQRCRRGAPGPVTDARPQQASLTSHDDQHHDQHVDEMCRPPRPPPPPGPPTDAQFYQVRHSAPHGSSSKPQTTQNQPCESAMTSQDGGSNANSPRQSYYGDAAQQYASSQLIIRGSIESGCSDRQAGGRPLGGDSNADMATRVFSHGLISTSPVQRLLRGGSGNDDAVSSLTFFFRIVAFGLVSFLLAFALHSQLPGVLGNLKVCLGALIMTSASLPEHCSGRSTEPSTPQSDTIDNVKTEIQATTGQKLRGLRCTISQQLRITPRLFPLCPAGLLG